MMQNATLAVCHTVWRFAAINLMTLVLMIAGLGVFGVAPALTACCWAMSRRDERTTGQRVAGMWQQWRAEFVRANLASLPSACVLAGCLLAMPHTDGPLLAVAIGAAVLTAQFALATVYGISQVHGGVAAALGNGVRVFLASPLRLLALLAISAVLCLLAVAQPLFALYGLASVTARAAVALLGPAFDATVHAAPDVAPDPAWRIPSRTVHPREIGA